MAYPYIIQGDNVTLVIDGVPHTINRTHLSYQKVVEAIKNNAWANVKELINPAKTFIAYSRGKLSIVDAELYWQGKPFHNSLTDRMINMLNEGFDITPMVNFMENLMQNPSKQAVNELYGFLEKNNLPITPDGHFLAYKRVRADYKDVHSGTMDNSVGKFVEMERNLVDDNRNNTCSTGLHFCSHEYLKSFGGDRTVIVKINPKDVVSIPSDYNDSKGRTCRYEVIGEVDKDPKNEVEFTKPVQANANSVPTEPKKGSSVFYRGYTDGYTGEEFRDLGMYDWKQEIDYEEGYDKGENDRLSGRAERYRYENKQQVNTQTWSTWPHPKS